MVEERIGDAYLVKSGLKPGEQVIIEGVQRVRPGMQVKAVSKPAAKAGE
jgi:membrane fusion protein, multidrug efflux system